ncbi:alpha/beta fold hydrolase [Neobacillus massiliamazoniensis]|uniref:Alpha/beta hydrolase fold protein n=1 Tax=Neobacillus massiliamazoniensis TaxID=1499688 RepID=A0A0U1NRT5_9BACI|nr:alpha/beta hydrolase [Neobacillus massiliamazoniensis]CRK80734.1 alpha/beta hydrolase fold protein [Neobacillus massiliamazoniensis]
MTALSKTCSGIPFLRLGVGDPLVFIHGLGEVKESWANQFEFADQYDLIIPDLRGHGEYLTDGEISIPNFARDIIQLLTELGIESAHICGLSMGGAVAQEIYRQAPKMCRSLILVSTFHFMPKSLGKIFFKYQRGGLNSNLPYIQKELAARICLYSWKKENIDWFYQFYKPNKDYFLKSLEACIEVNNLCLLPKIKVPTLIIGGQYDSILPVWIQHHMHKQIPHSEFVIFRNSGHFTKLEAKDAFNKVLRSFLTKVGA